VGLAARPRERLCLEREHAEVVREEPPAELRVEGCGELVVLRRDADRIATRLPVVLGAGRAPELAVGVVALRAVVSRGDESGDSSQRSPPQTKQSGQTPSTQASDAANSSHSNGTQSTSTTTSSTSPKTGIP
jgi:hypothetical protein